MTEMMMAPWEQGSGRLLTFACAGQDEEAVGALWAVLQEETRPANAIEKMWLRDIALLTVRIEQLRLVQIAVHRFLLQDRARRPRTGGDTPENAVIGEWAVNADEVAAVQNVLNGTLPGNDTAAAMPAAAFERLLAMTYVERLEIFERLAQLECGVRADRDRVIACFDQRRRNTVQDAAALKELNRAPMESDGDEG